MAVDSFAGAPVPAPANPMAVMPTGPGVFEFRPRVARYIGTSILAFLVTALTLGLFYPYAVVLVERYRAKASTIDGRRLEFTGLATALWLRWVWWLFLTVVTLGIYSFWWIPKMHQWRWEHLRFVD
ncbi:DUF898 domain-containing protein [Demequina rhizosphaerae]|uniref:DUF898 domain-containing protein n=1 Tax=Demequina rhizosphaerae TaxID=1638985 RepID=UPI000AF7AA8B|nr:DUF898 domain-containing protein [Demequina rhizosphaerae]